MQKSILKPILVLFCVSLNVFAQSAPTQNNNAQSTKDFLDQLQAESHCDPTMQSVCYYRAYSTVKLYEILKRCNELQNWIVTYVPNAQPNKQISLQAGQNGGCNISINNTAVNPPQTKTCVLTQQNIQSMEAYPQAEQYLAQYDQTQQPLPDSVMYSIFGAFYGCLKGDVNPEFLQSRQQS